MQFITPTVFSNAEICSLLTIAESLLYSIKHFKWGDSNFVQLYRGLYSKIHCPKNEVYH